MTNYQAVAASLRACTDPQKIFAAEVIEELLTLAAGWRDQHARELAETRADALAYQATRDQYRIWLDGARAENSALREAWAKFKGDLLMSVHGDYDSENDTYLITSAGLHRLLAPVESALAAIAKAESTN